MTAEWWPPGARGVAHWPYNHSMTNTDKKPARELMPAPPTPGQIKQARMDTGQTQQQAAAMVYVDGRAWRRWESGDRQMDLAHWELYRIKTIGLTPKK